jgi:hypothetical protein
LFGFFSHTPTPFYATDIEAPLPESPGSLRNNTFWKQVLKQDNRLFCPCYLCFPLIFGTDHPRRFDLNTTSVGEYEGRTSSSVHRQGV